MNKVIIRGNLGGDPDLKELSGDTKVAKFNVAVTEKYRNQDGTEVKNTTWFSIEVWNKMAEVVCKYLKKGSDVLVEGKFATEKWNDEEGNPKVKYVIKASAIEFLDKVRNNEAVTDEAPY